MAKTLALDTKLYVETNVPGTFVKVGNINNISVPGPVKGEVDVTDFDSEAMEALPTLPNNGDVSFGGFYNDPDVGQALLLTDALDDDSGTRNFRIEFTSQGVKFTFLGFVKSFVPSAGGPNDPYKFTSTVRVTGPVTKAALP